MNRSKSTFFVAAFALFGTICPSVARAQIEIGALVARDNSAVISSRLRLGGLGEAISRVRDKVRPIQDVQIQEFKRSFCFGGCRSEPTAPVLFILATADDGSLNHISLVDVSDPMIEMLDGGGSEMKYLGYGYIWSSNNPPTEGETLPKYRIQIRIVESTEASGPVSATSFL